jgi:formate hydrogenlyase subunit 6/NADH:ubiquinone oxidoreductase subunit I
MPKGKLRKTDNIMDKGKLTKDTQYHGQRETDKRQTISWPKGNCFQLPFGHGIVCLLSASLCPWYCLFFVSFPLAMNGQRETDKRQTISWPKGNWQKADNIMAKGKLTKDRQYHGQKEADKRQTISWPQGNWQRHTCQFPFVHDIVCLCQFPFGHDVVCLLSVSLCPWYCMSFVSFP